MIIFAEATYPHMSKINRSLSSRVDGMGKSEILLRFVGGRGAVWRLHSGLRINPARWNPKKEEITIPKIGTQEQKELLRISRELDNLCHYLIETYTAADKDKVDAAFMYEAIERYQHPERFEGHVPFFDAFDRYLDYADMSATRRRNFMVLRRLLKRFELYTGETLDLDKVNADTLYRFRRFLTDEHLYAGDKQYEKVYEAFPDSKRPKQRGPNTLAEKLEKFRSFFKWASKTAGYTDNYPFEKFSVDDPVYGTPYYITIEERDRIARTDLHNHPELAVQRDIFVFQCLIGCRVSDLLQLKKSSVIDGAVEYIARKTRDNNPVVVRVPLTAKAREIIERYAGLPGDRLLPFVTAQRYNKDIKRIFLAARVNRLVTVLDPLTREEVRRPLNEVASSHLARRTFVGNLYKKVKDPNIIGSMSGHAEGSKAFARYRAIDDDLKREIVGLLDGE